jgi:hypothetical protein
VLPDSHLVRPSPRTNPVPVLHDTFFNVTVATGPYTCRSLPKLAINSEPKQPPSQQIAPEIRSAVRRRCCQIPSNSTRVPTNSPTFPSLWIVCDCRAPKLLSSQHSPDLRVTSATPGRGLCRCRRDSRARRRAHHFLQYGLPGRLSRAAASLRRPSRATTCPRRQLSTAAPTATTTAVRPVPR